MPRDSHIELPGEIIDASGGGKYKISTANGLVLGQLAGRMKKNKIMVIPGDKVFVSVSPYDISHGLITQRVRR